MDWEKIDITFGHGVVISVVFSTLISLETSVEKLSVLILPDQCAGHDLRWTSDAY